MLRVVAGRLRGRKLDTLPGKDVRPTAERVREAIFNKLVHGLLVAGGAPLTGVRVLDAFAGTGALGFEALSRGADHVTFIENDAASARLIERNADHLGVAANVTVLRRDATAPGPCRAPVDLVLMDAPYRAELTQPALEALRAAGWLTEAALVVVELGRDEAFDPPDGFETVDDRRYGAARVIFLRRAA